MRKGKKPTGKKPQPHQDVPPGWQDRLEDFCRTNWRKHAKPGEAFDLAAFTGISRKTFFNAKRNGWFTKSMFATLAQAVGCGTRTELLRILSPPPPATVPLNTIQKPPPPTSLELKSKIEAARQAGRKHDEEGGLRLWEEVLKQAETENNKPAQIRAQLETAVLQLRGGSDLDEIVSILDKCIQEAQSVDLGDDRTRLLQLLGEAHRLKRDFDKARGFLASALEHSRSLGHKLDEGWAFLALSALENSKERRMVSATALDLIQKAYDCFASVYVSGDAEKQRAAKEGFANCHSWRATVFDHIRIDDAMAEFARALEVYRELGSDYEWNVADVLFHRGDLHARADDPQLAGKDLIAAAEAFKKLGDRLMEAKSVMGIAELLDHVGKRVESKNYFEAAAEITMQQNNRKGAAWIWFRYACKLFELREFEKGLSIFETLLAADWMRPGQKLDILKMLWLSVKASGLTENVQKEEMEVLSKFSKAALEIIDFQIANTTSADERRRLTISKGLALAELDEHDKAVECFRRGIEAFETVNDRRGVIECWSHIAQVMGKTKKRKEEREAYEKVLALVGDERDSFHRPMTLTMLAQLDIFEKRFEEARNRLNQAEQENEKLLNPAVMLIVHDLRSKLPPA
jgi:tetratricopeptide (TPR) repeat protein